MVPDATADARFADNPLVTGAPGIRFYAGMPLATPDGHALGTFCVIDYKPKDIRPADLTTLSEIARIAMSILDFRRTVRQARTAALAITDRVMRVVEGLPVALVLSDKAGTIRLVNRQAEAMFGYDTGELDGVDLERLMPERFRERHIGLRQAFLQTMTARVMGAEMALFGLRKDDTEFSLEIALIPIDLDDEPMVLAAIVDISLRREGELQKDQLRRDLERSNAELLEFAYAASHDLKAPLRAIGNLAGWVREDVETIAKPDTLANLAVLQNRAGRLQTLVDGLLAYSRVGLPDSVEEDVDIAAMVQETAAMLAMPPVFIVTCDTEVAVIRTCRAPLQAVLHNLISNAWQHHDRSEGSIAVSMRLRDRLAEFRVQDDGPGIAKPFQDRIMGIFQTLQSRDIKETAGIGLAIVKKRVEHHGGTIHVESDPPARGSTFIFTWKVNPPWQPGP